MHAAIRNKLILLTYMENINRSKCALSPMTEQLFNTQIAMEGNSSARYLAMASWCDTRGYKRAAAFLYRHAEEEREHMMKLFHYVNDVGGQAAHPDIVDVQHDFQSFRQVFELVLAHEAKVTQAVHELADHCLAVKDFATFNFLQWFVAEQIEEETLARRALELFDVIGEEGIGLYTIDKALGALHRDA